MSTLRIATRASALALHQATLVQEGLAAHGVASELVTYTTLGDRRLDEPLRAIGAKGLFTAELERDLAGGAVDCCVHSLKDLPTESPSGLDVVALLPREDPRDAMVVPSSSAVRGLEGLPLGARVGTSSLRRRAQLHALRADLQVVELRGNVPTRLQKVDRGECDAAILAAAGLHRLGLRDRVVAYLEPPGWLPAAGQGAIAVQARVEDAATIAVLRMLHDETTAVAVRAERAFLAALEGGCQVPIGALVLEGAGHPVLHGMLADIGGLAVLRDALPLDVRNPEDTGRALAERMRRAGGAEILAGLRRDAEVLRPQPE